MSEKELKMFDVDAQLDAVFGKEGTPERKAAEDRANAFFTGQIIEEARKKANMTLTFRYKIQALDFVDKSMDDVDLKRALVELLDFAQSQVEQETKAQSLTVKTDKNDVNLPYEDILYIETAPVPHKLIAHTKLNLVEFYGKIAEVAKLDDIFFQTHRSFVVNVSNVASVDRTANMVFFEGDESCLLSRTRKKEFLERLKNR